MRDRHQPTDRLARTVARSILSFNLTPFAHFTLTLITFLHVCIALSHPHSKIHNLLKWFEPSTYMRIDIIVYALIVPVLAVSIGILLQFWWTINESSLKTNAFKYYSIKITMILSYALSQGCMQTGVAAAAKANFNNQDTASVFGGVLLGFLIFWVFLYILLLINSSPQEKRTYALFGFPNSLFLLNLCRPVLAGLSTLEHRWVAIFSMVIILPLGAWALKRPLLTWRYNKVSQTYLCAVITWMFLTILEFLGGSSFEVGTYVIGVPSITFCLVQGLQTRIVRVIKDRRTTVLKCKALIYLTFNIEWERDNLDLFLMIHHQACKFTHCKCEQLMMFYRKEKDKTVAFDLILEEQKKERVGKAIQMMKTPSKLIQLGKDGLNSGEEREQKKRHEEELIGKQDFSEADKIKEKQLWFELIVQIMDRKFLEENIQGVLESERKVILGKLREIRMCKSQILLNQLDHHYESMTSLWSLMANLQKFSQTTYLFLIRYYLLELKGQEKLESSIQQEHSKNIYPLNFYRFQTGITKMRISMMKLIQSSEEFWRELSSFKPDQKKILSLLESMEKIYMKVRRQYETAVKKDSSAYETSEYGKNWSRRTKILLNSIFIPFENVFCNKKTELNEKELEALQEQFEGSKPKSLIFYDVTSKTGMCTVNLHEGEKFARIINGNKLFWNLLNTPQVEGATPDAFLPKEMIASHREKMKEFLNSGEYYLDYHPGFIIDSTNRLIQIEFSGQMLPNLYQGLQMSLFIRPCENRRAIFLLNKGSNILNYNQNFERRLKERSIDNFDELITKEITQTLERDSKCEFYFEADLLCLKLYHQILDKDPLNSLFFIEIEGGGESFSQKTFDDVKEEHLDMRITMQGSQGEERKQEDNEMGKVLQIVRNDKKCHNINRWFIVSTLILICVSAFLIGACVESEVKNNNFSSYLSNQKDLGSMIHSIIVCDIKLRKANIMRYKGSEMMAISFLSQISQEKRQIEERLADLNRFFNQQIWVPELLPNNSILSQSQTVLMTISKSVLASYTTLIHSPNLLDFSYNKESIPTPLQDQVLTFYRALYGSYFSLIPYLQDSASAQLKSEVQAEIDFQSTETYFICIALLILSVGLFLVSWFMARKIQEALIIAYSLLENIKVAHMESRMNRLAMFRENYFNDLIKIEAQQELEKVKDVISKTRHYHIRESVYESMKEKAMLQSSQIDSHDLENTERELNMGEVPHKNHPKEQKNKKNKVKISVERGPINNLRILIPILPILIVTAIILGVRINANSKIEALFSLAELNHARIQKISLIESSCMEVGFQSETVNQQVKGIKSSFHELLGSLYELIRESKRQASPNSIIEFIRNKMYTQKFCEIINELTEKEEYQQVKKIPSNDSLCSNFLREVLIEYIEKARLHFNLYNHSMTASEIDDFVGDTSHHSNKYFEKTGYYLNMIFEDENEYIEKAIELEVKSFKLGIIIPSVLLIAILMLIYHFWLKAFRQDFFALISKIKIIFEVVSFREIEADPELTRSIREKEETIKFLS